MSVMAIATTAHCRTGKENGRAGVAIGRPGRACRAQRRRNLYGLVSGNRCGSSVTHLNPRTDPRAAIAVHTGAPRVQIAAPPPSAQTDPFDLDGDGLIIIARIETCSRKLIRTLFDCGRMPLRQSPCYENPNLPMCLALRSRSVPTFDKSGEVPKDRATCIRRTEGAT